MLVPSPEIAALEQRLSGPIDGFRFASAPTTIDPLDLVRSGSVLFGSAFYFATPGGPAIGGLGTAHRVTSSGPDRFPRLRAEAAATPVPDGFVRFLGYAFSADGPRTPEWDGFASAALVLPQIAVVADGGGHRIMVSVPPGVRTEPILEALASLRTPLTPLVPDPGDHSVESHPHATDWRTEVADAVGAIRAGAMRKVVLTRSVIVRSDTAPEPFELVHHLECDYPQCHPFGWQANGAAFIGASPELLVSLRGRRIRSNPLAGSAPRGEGEEDDQALGQSLMASEKDRIEHALVVEDIAERLRSLAAELTVPALPALKRMATVQHLSTEIRGTLRAGADLFELLDVLHPTPAVGGTPRSEAVAFIDKVEGIDRGWYTGGVGWLDSTGDGDVALGLRCGLVRGTTSHLYAGAGIVADSDPEAELFETRLKFRPLLSLLTAT